MIRKTLGIRRKAVIVALTATTAGAALCWAGCYVGVRDVGGRAPSFRRQLLIGGEWERLDIFVLSHKTIARVAVPKRESLH